MSNRPVSRAQVSQLSEVTATDAAKIGVSARGARLIQPATHCHPRPALFIGN